MFSGDTDDQWSRYSSKLRERIAQITDDLASGACDMPTYQNYCGQIAMAREAIDLVRAVRRGDDLRPPPVRDPLLSPED